MADYILVTETGSDIHEETARRHGIVVVPMHVNFGEVSRDDDSFPPEELYEYYKTTGKLPQTSGCTPVDFSAAFDRIHEKYPTAKILYWPTPPQPQSPTAARTSPRRAATT